jgi:TetR/AcrR family transcriptional repressor of mexJK operon
MPELLTTETSCPPAARGRPKDMAKRKAILDAAQKIFSQKGFTSASMEQIAKEAGVSKLTLYSHFEHKDDLFISTVEQRCFSSIPFDLLNEQYHGLPAHDALFKFGRAMLDGYLTPQSVATFRLMVGEVLLHPHLMKTYYETAVGGMLKRIVVVLQYISEQGEYQFPHLRRTAMHLYSLIKDNLHVRFVFDAQPLPTVEEQNKHLREAIALFLRAHKI